MSDSDGVVAPAHPPNETELRMRAVTIGEPQRLDGAIELRPYNETWPARYAVEAERVAGILGSRALRLEPVGSRAPRQADHRHAPGRRGLLGRAGVRSADGEFRVRASHPRAGLVPTPSLQGTRCEYQSPRVLRRLRRDRQDAAIPGASPILCGAPLA